jgi:hypothetical protein
VTTTATPNATEVVVTVDTEDELSVCEPLAELVAERLRVAVHRVHIDVEADEGSAPAAGDEADHDEQVVAAIVERLQPGSVLVARSDHATRWTGKQSITERVLEQWSGLAFVAGPRARWPLGEGPVLVAVNGSAAAERAVPTAELVGRALGRSVELSRVGPRPLGADDDDAARALGEARAYLELIGDRTGHPIHLLSSNDPISALVAEANHLQSAAVALATTGDRSIPRPTLSRVSWGLVHEASCPVALIGANWRGGTPWG